MNRFRCLACLGEYFDVQLDGTPYQHVCGFLPADDRKPERPRDNARDENPLLDRRGRIVGIRSEGAGVKCLTNARVDEPTWITDQQLEIDKAEQPTR